MMEEDDIDPQKIFDKIKEYVKVRTELSILTAIDKGTQLFANLLTDGLVIILIVLSGLFASLALGFYLSELLGNSYVGFLIVAGVYLLGALILISIKDNYLEKRIVNSLIAKFFKDRKK